MYSCAGNVSEFNREKAPITLTRIVQFFYFFFYFLRPLDENEHYLFDSAQFFHSFASSNIYKKKKTLRREQIIFVVIRLLYRLEESTKILEHWKRANLYTNAWLPDVLSRKTETTR